MEKLELKDLAPYLPYELKVLCENQVYLMTIGNLKNYLEGRFNIKPILRPLNDLAKEIEVSGEKFIATELLDSDEYPVDFFIDTKYEYMIDWIESYRNQKDYQLIFLPFGLINQLIEWHFDVFGLIPAGLAIDINTLEK